MVNSQNNIIANIQKSSDNIFAYQNNLNKVMNNYKVLLTNQSKYLKQSNEKYKNLNSSIKNIIQNTKDMQRVIVTAKKYSDHSTSIIRNMMDEINKIADTSQKINLITELINDISEKTRLLAVNSSIEASRAGDAGKGFSVVAVEIRKLAKLSSDAAIQIAELIKMNDKSINSGVNKTKEVFEVLNHINSSIGIISNIIEQMNSTIQESKKNSQIINIFTKSFSQKSEGHIQSLEKLDKLKSLLNTEITKIRDISNAFTLKDSNGEIVRDMKLFTKEDKEKQKENKSKRKTEKQKIKKDLEEQKRKGKLLVKGTGKVRSLSLLKSKRKVSSQLKK